MSTVATTETKRFGVGSVIALVVALGVTGLIGVRVKDKLAQKKALAAAQAAAIQPTAAPVAKSRGRGPSLVKPEPLSWQPRVPVTGTLEPIQQADVGFKVGGRLSVIKAKVGDTVKTGQPLAMLDASEAAAQAGVAFAGVRAAEISLEMAKDGQQRSDVLFQQSAVPEVEKTSATQRARLASAQLAQARAQAQLASVMVGNATLAAPFGGLVTRAPNGIGKIVAPGEPLFHVEDTSVLKLSATVSESDAKLVELGAAVSLGSAPQASGKLTAVLGSLDPSTRRVPVLAEIPNGPEVGLLSGSFVRAEIASARSIQVLKVPGAALRQGSQDELVLRKDGKAHLVRVTFSTAPDGSMLVRKGLEATDDVVLSPGPEVKEGDAIEFAPAAP